MCCRMFEHHNCQQDAYDDREGLHPNNEQDKNAMVNSINTSFASVLSFVDTQASVDIAAQRLKDMAMASMETMLQSEPNLLLRLCWIYLPDFVIFEYDLPAAYKEDKTLAATVQQTRKWPARLLDRLGHVCENGRRLCFRLTVNTYVLPWFTWHDTRHIHNLPSQVRHVHIIFSCHPLNYYVGSMVQGSTSECQPLVTWTIGTMMHNGHFLRGPFCQYSYNEFIRACLRVGTSLAIG